MQSLFFARAWFSYKWENHQNRRSHKLGISDSNLTCDPIFENGFKWCFDWWENKVNPTIILEITMGWSSFSHWHLAPQITRSSRTPSYRSLFGRVLFGENDGSRTADMPVGGRAWGDKWGRATIASVLRIELEREREIDAGRVHSDATQLTFGARTMIIWLFRTKGRLTSRRRLRTRNWKSTMIGN